MRFLIAGSSGFLGTRLRERLRASGHDVTLLVRRPVQRGKHEVQWDPYSAPLDPAVVDEHDVVVNLAGSPMAGNPYSGDFRKRLRASRVRTTARLADAVAAGDRRPVFLAQNGISWYGDHGAAPLDESADSTGDAFMTDVTREWQAATAPAAEAGARVVVLRTAPVMDRRSQPLDLLRLLFGAGLGGRLGDGRQHMPVISARDWVDAAIHLSSHDDVSGPANLCCPQTPTNAEFTRELARLLHRPALVPVPTPVIKAALGPLSQLPLDSLDTRPAVLEASGFSFRDRDVRAVLAEGLDPTR